MIDSEHNAASAAPADRAAIATVQREIIAAMHAGRRLSQAHKEGGTTIGWERDRFVIEEYGEWSSRREFTDDSAFLDALWKRYEWMVSPNRGDQRQSEKEAWRFILHELRRDRMSASNPGSSMVRRLSWMRAAIALLVLALTAIGFGVTRLLQVRTVGAPFGQSVRVGESLATLVRTQERYIPSLHRNPDRDRFRIDLRLTPLIGDAKPRMISLARSLQHNAFHPGTKILGTDGPLLWMLVPELQALDLRTSRLVTLKELRAANPALEEIWHTARFHFTDRLHLMSADRQRSYTIDPDSLRAQSDDTPPRITWQDPAPSATAMLCLGAPVSSNEWVFALSVKERDASFRVGSSLSPDPSAERVREPRTLHRVTVEPTGSRLRIVSITELANEVYTGGALMRSARGSGALRLAESGGFLLVHRIGTTLAPGIAVTLVDDQGRSIWTINTGLRELDQILPEAALPVFIGRLPAPEGKVPETVAVAIDTATGSANTRSLQP